MVVKEKKNLIGLPPIFWSVVQMPYSKDIRVGQGWFNTNVNWFYNYLDEMDEELIVKTDCCESEVAYHNNHLEEKIEEKVNDYISWKVFGETRSKLDENDSLPEEYPDDVWGFVYDHICMFVKRKPTWYELRSTLPEQVDEEDETCEVCGSTETVRVEDYGGLNMMVCQTCK
jgi:hypothetical protein